MDNFFEFNRAPINWSARELLYTDVALMGLRIDVTDLSQAGFMAPLLVLLTLVATLFGGYLIARAFGQTKKFSILMSGAVGICGVSAAAAICAALDDCESRKEELAITVADFIRFYLHTLFNTIQRRGSTSEQKMYV